MTRFEYLEKLHDLIYQANRADVRDLREDWQESNHVLDHCNPLSRIAESILTDEEFELFCDCLGDFDSFKYNHAKLFTVEEEE